MKINQRGQSALEYLMTYGWALVVIVIVVAALVLLVGNPASASDTCSSPGSQLNITNQELSATGWKVRVSNISGRTLGNSVGPIYVSAVNTPAAGVATLPYAMYPALNLAPGSSADLNANISYPSGRYRTDFTVLLNDGDFNRTVSFSCSGTA